MLPGRPQQEPVSQTFTGTRGYLLDQLPRVSHTFKDHHQVSPQIMEQVLVLSVTPQHYEFRKQLQSPKDQE